MYSTTLPPGTRVITHLDLPDTDGLPSPCQMQPAQSRQLTSSIRKKIEERFPDEYYLIAEDLGVYWRMTNPPLDGCTAPDWMFVPEVPVKIDGELRRSYVMWIEGTRPLILIDYVFGDGSEEHDTTPQKGKFWIYERMIGGHYYVIFDAFNGPTLEVFENVRGRYRAMKSNRRGHFPIVELDVELGIRDAKYDGVEASWLRFFDSAGKLLMNGQEQLASSTERARRERRRANQASHRADQEKARADEEKARADEEKARADRTAAENAKFLAKLKANGIDPGSL